MAMLAEPRRKQKWSLNPRGKEWSEDSSKFGQKMLEKMGWTTGKGLGAKEQGMTEHIRISFKNDNSGIGFKSDEMDKAWTETQDGFNDFLKQLQKTQGKEELPVVENIQETLSGKSLEQKSKQSRARVHYQKFTRGKDVNKYTPKDLANIFGQKELSTNNIAKEEKAVEEKVDNHSEPIGSKDNRGGVITINSGSISDYFKNKVANPYKISDSTAKSRQSDSEEEPMYAGFGFSSSQSKPKSDNTDFGGLTNYAFVNPSLNLADSEPVTSSVKPDTPKKRKGESKFYVEEVNTIAKKIKSDTMENNDCTNGFVNPGLNLANEAEESRNGVEFEVSRAEFGLTNSAFDPEDEHAKKKRVTFNDHVEYSTDSVKKKKIKGTLDKFEVENKKHKRKRKHEEVSNNQPVIGFVNEGLDFEEVATEELDNEINERKSRKAKKKRLPQLETIVEAPEEDKQQESTNAEMNESIASESAVEPNDKTKKKKKKMKKEKLKDKDNSEQEENIPEVETETDIVVKKSKKKRLTISETDNNSEETKKKKKKKSGNKDATEYEVITIVDEPEDSVIDLTEPTLINGEAADELQVIEKATKKIKKKKLKLESIKDDSKEPEGQNGKEVFNKENTPSENSASVKSKKKSKKEKRKSIDQAVDGDSANVVEETEEIIEEKFHVDETFASSNNELKIRSPWNETARMSKKLLKSLFHRNAVSSFPGSNFHDIKGYGAEISYHT